MNFRLVFNTVELRGLLSDFKLVTLLFTSVFCTHHAVTFVLTTLNHVEELLTAFRHASFGLSVVVCCFLKFLLKKSPTRPSFIANKGCWSPFHDIIS